ncbi:PaaI family thioesterase [Nocardiopsis rhodophaea]|uniref:PaaI family thioesterase n=1 Tax=Nocardiopsis rhodophaea TaxID=280238 RepID=UPI0031E2EFB0
MSNQDAPAVPEEWGEPRTRTVTWHDPIATAKAGAELSGLDYLRAVAAGELPPAPISRLLGGFTDMTAEKGEVWMSCTPDESVYNPIGLVHGGLVCTLLDSVIGCAVHTTLPAGSAYSSIELKVNYLRPIHANTGAIHARGWVTKPGRRVAFGEGEITDGAGKVLATASGSCLIFEV